MFQRVCCFLLMCLLAGLTSSAFAGIDERISMDFRDADIRDVCKIMTEKGGLGLSIEKSVRGNVTIRFKDQTIEECLTLLLSANGFDWELQNKTVVVADEMKFPVKTIHRKLTFAGAPDAARIISMAIKKDIKVATDNAQNALVLTARQKTLAQAENIIQDLDKPVPFYAVRVTLSQGKENLSEGSFQVKFQDYGKFSTVVPLVYPTGADQPPETATTGLDLQISPKRLLSATELECDLECRFRLLKKWNASVPIIASGKLTSQYRVTLGQPTVIDLAAEDTRAVVTLTLDVVK
jgi:type II secretory pathway component HofQ